MRTRLRTPPQLPLPQPLLLPSLFSALPLLERGKLALPISCLTSGKSPRLSSSFSLCEMAPLRGLAVRAEGCFGERQVKGSLLLAVRWGEGKGGEGPSFSGWTGTGSLES